MKRRFIWLALFVVLLLSACDLFSPDRFYGLVDAYNAVEQSGDSNYWRRYYFTGSDPFEEEFTGYESLVIDGTLYVILYKEDNTEFKGEMRNYRIDLDTMVSSTMAGPDITDDYSLESLFRAGSDLVVQYQYYDPATYYATNQYPLFRYCTDTREWDELTTDLPIFTAELLSCQDRVFYLIRDTDFDYTLFEYADHDLSLRHQFPTVDSLSAVLNDTNMLFMDTSDPDMAWQYNFTTNTMDQINLTYGLDTLDSEYLYEDIYLLDPNRLIFIHSDGYSSDPDTIICDPLLLDWVDLDGDQVWNRKALDTVNPPGMLTSAVWQGDIYIAAQGAWYNEAVDENTYSWIMNPEPRIYRIDKTSLEIVDMGAIPPAPSYTGGLCLKEVGGVLYVDYSDDYYLLPDGAGGGTWEDTATSGYFSSIDEDIEYNGKYYRLCHQTGFPSTSFILEYTPPVF